MYIIILGSYKKNCVIMFSLKTMLLQKIFVYIFFKSDEDKANFVKLIEVMKQSKKGKTLGVFSKENYPGAFMDAWRTALKSESFDTVSYVKYVM